MSTTVLIENKEINGAYKELSNQYKGRKDNYFALLYLMKKFKITLEEASSFVSFGENECGIDAFYHDRTTRNLYLFQFKWFLISNTSSLLNGHPLDLVDAFFLILIAGSTFMSPSILKLFLLS